MNNVVRLHRDTVQEVLQEIAEEAPDVIVAFTAKGGQFLIHESNVPSVTYLIGALERIKHDLLNGQP